MFELSGVNYEEVLEQGDSILVRVIGGSSYRGFESSGLYCICKSKSEIFNQQYGFIFANILDQKITWIRKLALPI